MEDTAFEAEYELGEELGRGAFGVVRAGVQKRTGQICAIKMFSKSKSNATSIRWRAEAQLLKRLDHPNIVKLVDIVETPTTLYLVMELMRGGELMAALIARGSYTERVAKHIIAKLVEAVGYLHQQEIIHRDLKPENILLMDDDPHNINIKLADFGLSLVMDEFSMIRSKAGTPLYMAPEVIRGRAYSEQADMWSVGVIMYLLLCGRVPFSADDEDALRSKIVAGEIDYSMPIWDSISDDAKNLLGHLLKVNPTERYDAQETLRHPWITGDSAGTQPLDTVLELMRSFNIERKFRKGVFAVMASRRLVMPVLGHLTPTVPLAAPASASAPHSSLSTISATSHNSAQSLPQPPSRAQHPAALHHHSASSAPLLHSSLVISTFSSDNVLQRVASDDDVVSSDSVQAAAAAPVETTTASGRPPRSVPRYAMPTLSQPSAHVTMQSAPAVKPVASRRSLQAAPPPLARRSATK
eukprot:TRINITY_DN8127_c0_g1_i1.p1 TRINITY_DN8127_c0_g1~~TRINITY_DN8127_c0_g1_i1.p1  ORF type:complete len:539 (-),score=83.35 TRINITY_DN8127_c0_g1_i1:132-1538(-)